MFRTLAIPAAACILLAFGCEKKAQDPVSKVPTTAPSAAKAPGQVLEHLQYAVIRNDPAHLKAFVPPATSDRLDLGTTQRFHILAGHYGFALTPEEIDKLGVRHLLEAGYISDRFTSRAIREASEGKREIEPGMEQVNQSRLDMPYTPDGMNKKAADEMLEQLKAALEKDIPAAFAAGLCRRLKAIPAEGWAALDYSIGSNPAQDYKDLVLKKDGVLACTVTVGANEDETMYITAIEFEKPGVLAKLFPKADEPAEAKEAKEPQK